MAGIFFRDGEILMGCRHPCEGGRFVGHWEFPGGRVEDGESASEALEREFQEELNCKIQRMKFFRQLQWSYPDKDIELHYYFVELESKDTKTFELSAHSELGWFSLEKALEMQILPANRGVIESLKDWDFSKPIF